MILTELILGLEECQIINKKDINIENLSQNSKKNVKNTLFFAISGTKTFGKLYVAEAIKNGAVAVVVEKPLAQNITQIVVKDVRKAMAIISANFFCNPQKKLKIVGITGTNGKTSCSYIIARMLKSIGKSVGVIGTNGIYFNDEKFESEMTTPDSIELFEIFSKMVKRGIEYCVMEVSAHAIFFDKIYGIDFAVKALTNITFDHLDFFKTQKNYKLTKEKFFKNGKNFVINNDDSVGKKILKTIKNSQENSKKIITFGEKTSNLQYFHVNCAINGTKFEIKYNSKIYKLNSKLVGEFNVQNICLSIGVLLLLSFDLEKVIQSVYMIENLPGRFDIVQNDFDIPIIIDYAHTYKSLETFLEQVNTLSTNKNIIVFGAPGERDTTKRFPMGKLAGKLCDYVFVTSDNPASENPRRIAYEILEGVKTTKNKAFFEENRKKCIKKAIFLAKERKNCNVLIVGKGIEQTQVIGKRRIRYSDYDAVHEVLRSFK